MSETQGAPPMGRGVARSSDVGRDNLLGRIIGVYAILITANILVWAFAFFTFRDYPVLLGSALLAYTFGLRHAFDADHIAAIDNVTRKLMQNGQRPVGAGLFFSLGHSTVVVLLSIAVAITATALQGQFESFKAIGSVVGTLVSAGFLFLIAFANVLILIGVYQTFMRVKGGGPFLEEDFDMLLAKRGLLSRLFRPMFNLIRKSWHMYALGFLFGLGFDTATEIGLLGISAAGAAQHLPIWSMLIFPALFTAGMTLVDTTDSILMLGAYGWAFVKPIRKLYYNLVITAVSVVIAVLVGGVEALGLLRDKLGFKGGFWGWIGILNDSFGTLGYIIVGVFVAAWTVSTVVYRMNGYDRIEVTGA